MYVCVCLIQEGMSHQASLAAPRDQGQSTDEEAAVTAGLSAAAAKLTFIQARTLTHTHTHTHKAQSTHT